MFESFKNYKNFIIVAHDAGGGNILASLVKKLGIKDQSFFIVEGPSATIFQNKFGSIKQMNLSDLSSFLPNETIVLTGTSGASELERDVLKIARKNHFKNYSILDHWINLKLRFIPVNQRENLAIDFYSMLPDFLILTDSKACSVAEELGIPSSKIIKISNPYLEEMKIEFQTIFSSNVIKKNRIVYISEYFNSLLDPALSELDYLNDILKQFSQIITKLPDDFEFYIRLHPSEEEAKYHSLLKQYSFVKIGSQKVGLLEDLASANIVIGKTSMGLTVSAEVGLPTFSYHHPKFNFIDLGSKVKVINKINEELLFYFP